MNFLNFTQYSKTKTLTPKIKHTRFLAFLGSRIDDFWLLEQKYAHRLREHDKMTCLISCKLWTDSYDQWYCFPFCKQYCSLHWPWVSFPSLSASFLFFSFHFSRPHVSPADKNFNAKQFFTCYLIQGYGMVSDMYEMHTPK